MFNLRSPLGKIFYIYGCMKSGKSLGLLYQIDLRKSLGLSYIPVKPSLDTRDGSFIRTRHLSPDHSFEPEKSIVVRSDLKDSDRLLDYSYLSKFFGRPIKSPSVYFIDEVFMFNASILDFASELIKQGHGVVFSGLNYNFRGEYFNFYDQEGTMESLLGMAHHSFKSYATCDVCGSSKAEFTQRLNPDLSLAPYSGLELVVGDHIYQARCQECFKKPS